MEDQKTLQAGALVCQFADPVGDDVNDLLADCVVAASVVICRIFFAGDKLLGVEEFSENNNEENVEIKKDSLVNAAADLVDDCRLEINENGARDVLARARFGEESVEGVVEAVLVAHSDPAVRGDAVFQAVQLPASVADLAASLADVDRNTFSHV